jgi:putative heme-binding domain-containing protein
VGRELGKLARVEADPEVRSQLASTAKRLPASVALPILEGLWQNGDDVTDPHIPLLTWWALEPKCETDREAVLALLADRTVQERPTVRSVILERVMQRLAVAGGSANLLACARLLDSAAGRTSTNAYLTGLEKAFTGRTAGDLPEPLRLAIRKAWDGGATAGRLSLGLRLGIREALDEGLRLIADEKADRVRRLECIRTFGEIDHPRCVPVLLEVVRNSPVAAVRQEALGALQRYTDPAIPRAVLELYPARLPEANGVRAAALDLLTSRPGWTLEFLNAVDAGRVNPRGIPLAVIQKIQLRKDPAIGKLVTKHWGRVQPSTPREKQKEMARVIQVLKAGKGDATAGKVVFTNTCAKCHRLFGEGGEVGPDLTGYERDNTLYWLENIVDPSASIREEYTAFVIETVDGRTLTGVVAAQDKAAVTLRDAEGRQTTIAREKIEEMRASPVSIMPEGQLATLKDQQMRDLFAYLMSKPGPKR